MSTTIITEGADDLILRRMECMQDVMQEVDARFDEFIAAFEYCCNSSSSSSSSSSSFSSSSSSSSSTAPCVGCDECAQINVDVFYTGDPALVNGAISPTTNFEAVAVTTGIPAQYLLAFPLASWCYFEPQGLTFVDPTYDRLFIVFPRPGVVGDMKFVYNTAGSTTLAVPHNFPIADKCSLVGGPYSNSFGVPLPNRVDSVTIEACSTTSYSSSSSSSSHSSSSSSSTSSSSSSSGIPASLAFTEMQAMTPLIFFWNEDFVAWQDTGKTVPANNGDTVLRIENFGTGVDIVTTLGVHIANEGFYRSPANQTGDISVNNVTGDPMDDPAQHRLFMMLFKVDVDLSKMLTILVGENNIGSDDNFQILGATGPDRITITQASRTASTTNVTVTDWLTVEAYMYPTGVDYYINNVLVQSQAFPLANNDFDFFNTNLYTGTIGSMFAGVVTPAERITVRNHFESRRTFLNTGFPSSSSSSSSS